MNILDDSYYEVKKLAQDFKNLQIKNDQDKELINDGAKFT